MEQKSASKRVAFAMYPGSNPELQRGVFAYAEEKGWTLILNPYQSASSLKWVQEDSDLDGVVGFVGRSEMPIVETLPLPVVSISHTADPSIPTVTDDSVQTGAQAAKHLIGDSLFRRLGFFGRRAQVFSDDRCRGFCDEVSRAGCEVSVWLTGGKSDSYHWRDERDGLETWLRSLKPPVGIMVSDDPLIFPLLEACRRLGLRVPDDVAIVGVNNNVSICELTRPMLTSVDPGYTRIGREAAALLDRLMNKGKKPPGPILVPPAGVVKRKSTDMLAIDDPDIAAAVRFIREHLATTIDIDALAQRVGASRRKLESGFRRWLDCSPLQYISRTRVERAKQMMAATPRMKLIGVAGACGFTNMERFRVVFLKHAGIGASAYRKRLRNAATETSSSAQ